MGNKTTEFYYTGYGGAVGLRKYFIDRKYSLVGEKDLNSLIGWFVGVHVPFRKMKLNLDVKSVEKPDFGYHPPQEDKGRLAFDGFLYGVGIEAGRHWVWDRFSFEICTGIAYQNGIGYPGNFTFYRQGVFEYTVSQNAGLVGFVSKFAPRFELVLGVAF
jgi:hypothetical protein